MNNLNYQQKSFKNIMKHFGKHYYYATLLFPSKIKKDVFIVYAFVRRLDNIIDSHNLSQNQKKIKFKEWILEWKKILKNNQYQSKFEELNYFYEIIKKYNIKISLVNAFIKSMKFDISKVRIQTYQQLEKYMFGSAIVVGYFMLYIFNAFNNKTKHYAAELAKAMQLTNFIRDVDEDLYLNRIYLPLNDAKKFNIQEKDFLNKNFNNNFKEFIKYYINKTKKMYKNANLGIKYLPLYSKLPVLYASNLYQSILDEIIKNDYNIFQLKYRVNKIKKFSFFLKSLINLIFKKYD
ncbi:MAG: phytoene/squalene synthase family protein [Patescibacteria group bacterium]|nr:phytoene/squalene synthase family protein [Patescibacteria group bacterium]